MGYRYIGSKDKLSEVIIQEIRQIVPNAEHIIDLMAGTGLFSLALRENNYRVSSVDMMTYSYYHLHVQLLLKKAPEFAGVAQILHESHNSNELQLFNKSEYERLLEYLNNVEPIHGYFYEEFSPEGTPRNSSKPRKYFTPKNAAKIDALRKQIKEFRDSGIITQIEHSLLLHDLIMAVNDIANIAGTYGHYLSRFVKRATGDIYLSPTIFSSKGLNEGHAIYKGYAEEIAPHLEGDLCYIDPPYIKRQYAANYHILETIAREDEPEAIGESGLRPWRDQYSNFCSKVKIFDSFDAILSSIKCEHILISYSEDGLLNINDLLDFLSNYGIAEKKNIPYKRFKSNNTEKKLYFNEFLIYLHKNTY